MERLYKKPLGEILVSRGIITEEQLVSALEEQKNSGVRLGQALVSLEFAEEEQITEARALQLDVPYVNLQNWDFDSEVVQKVPASLALAYNLMPVEISGDRLTVAMSNPMDVEAIDLVQYETKLLILPALATESRIIDAIHRQYGAYALEGMDDLMEQAASNVSVEVETIDETDQDLDEVRRQSDRAPIVKMVNFIITQAARKRASDIHIEPRRNHVEVRYRIDGEMRHARKVPNSLRAAVTSRIKIMSELDIAERRLPQDGRITVRVDGRAVDLRVSTNPILYGERIVLRVLDRAQSVIPLESLGFSERDMGIFQDMISRRNGIILVTGPTGSGKTTTLYAALNMLESETMNIMTVEDPIEYELEGVSQTMVHARIGLTFATHLRTLLRQDPDVILVGEIRDGETADIAFRAALTGHLVLSTLHCNDAPSAITRLLDMDVEPFLVSSAIIGAQAQRLVRVLCPECKAPYEPDGRLRTLLGLDSNKKVTLYDAVGCSACDDSGYVGRTTICEIMRVNEEINKLSLARASAGEIRNAAIRAGMVTLRQDAVRKVLAGITTVDEVSRKVFLDYEELGTQFPAGLETELEAA